MQSMSISCCMLPKTPQSDDRPVGAGLARSVPALSRLWRTALGGHYHRRQIGPGGIRSGAGVLYRGDRAPEPAFGGGTASQAAVASAGAPRRPACPPLPLVSA